MTDEPSNPQAPTVEAPALQYERPTLVVLGSIRDLVADSGATLDDGRDLAPRG